MSEKGKISTRGVFVLLVLMLVGAISVFLVVSRSVVNDKVEIMEKVEVGR